MPPLIASCFRRYFSFCPCLLNVPRFAESVDFFGCAENYALFGTVTYNQRNDVLLRAMSKSFGQVQPVSFARVREGRSALCSDLGKEAAPRWMRSVDALSSSVVTSR